MGIPETVVQLASALRSDGWVNFLTGLGTARDKTTYSQFETIQPLTDVELSALYHGSDIAGRLVDIVPREMLRQGFGVHSANVAVAQLISERVRKLEVMHHVKMAQIWGRCFGGAAILIGADDGLDPQFPLEHDRIRSVTFLHVYDQRQMYPVEWDTDPKSEHFNNPKTYRLTNLRSGTSSVVHVSRLICFGGAITGSYEKNLLNGWDYSVLQRTYEAIRQFETAYKNAEYMMGDAVQAVFKVKGLFNIIASNKLEDLQTRAQWMDLMRSVTRAILLDADSGEEFEKIQTSFSGVAEMLDRAARRLSAATEIPVTILMGESPAGLQATGASDIRAWYDRIHGEREQELKPKLEKLVNVIAKAERVTDKIEIKFRPLWLETEKEKADREKVEADTALVWINAEVLTSEEVAIARFAGAEPQPYHIDPDTRLGNFTTSTDLSVAENAYFEPSVAESAAVEPSVVDPKATEIKATALNGAQVTAAIEIVKLVALGQLPRDAGIGSLQVMFNLTNEQAEVMMSSVGRGFIPQSLDNDPQL